MTTMLHCITALSAVFLCHSRNVCFSPFLLKSVRAWKILGAEIWRVNSNQRVVNCQSPIFWVFNQIHCELTTLLKQGFVHALLNLPHLSTANSKKSAPACSRLTHSCCVMSHVQQESGPAIPHFESISWYILQVIITEMYVVYIPWVLLHIKVNFSWLMDLISH